MPICLSFVDSLFLLSSFYYVSLSLFLVHSLSFYHSLCVFLYINLTHCFILLAFSRSFSVSVSVCLYVYMSASVSSLSVSLCLYLSLSVFLCLSLSLSLFFSNSVSCISHIRTVKRIAVSITIVRQSCEQWLSPSLQNGELRDHAACHS